jgi:hypothetical protein
MYIINFKINCWFSICDGRTVSELALHIILWPLTLNFLLSFYVHIFHWLMNVLFVSSARSQALRNFRFAVAGLFPPTTSHRLTCSSEGFFSGPLTERPLSDMIELIQKHGGSFEEKISPTVLFFCLSQLNMPDVRVCVWCV